MNWKMKIRGLKPIKSLVIILIPFWLYSKEVLVIGSKSEPKTEDKSELKDPDLPDPTTDKKKVSSKKQQKYDTYSTEQLLKKKEGLEKILKYGSHKERKSAMREVVGLPEEYCDTIFNILAEIIENDMDNSVRVVAIQTYMFANARQKSPTIIAALKDKSIEVKEAAVSAIQKLKLEEASQPLFEMLKDQDFSKNVRITPLIINTLADIDSEKVAFSFLETKLRSDTTIPELKGAIALYFGKMKDLRAEQVLIKIATDDNEDVIVRSYALNSLGKMQSTRAVEHIRSILRDLEKDKSKAGSKKYASLKLYAMSALVAMGDKNILQEIIAYTKDDDPNVRIRAIQQLSELNDPSIVELIEYKALRDPNKRVQKTAKDILEKMKKQEATASPETTNKDKNKGSESIEKIHLDNQITPPKNSGKEKNSQPNTKLIESFEGSPKK